MYIKNGKRLLDIIISATLILFILPIYIVLFYIVRKEMGSPVIFTQLRPGKNEKIFKMYKFRTMTEAKDKKGNYLSEEERITKFGKKLRETSLDELPELWNVLKGDMSLVGPRPQLVKDMVFMTKKQRMRHKVKPGLTGLAQINGRNNISWKDKLNYDLFYIKHISLLNDAKILILTIFKVVMKENINQRGMETAEDLGDYLLRTKKITKETYQKRMRLADKLLEGKG